MSTPDFIRGLVTNATVVVTLPCAYLLLLTALSWPLRVRAAGSGRTRFALVVPAHDEAAGIARTVHNLLALDWPPQNFQVIVVADNCSDDTAERARTAGATVLERRHETQRGKGYALEHAFQHILEAGSADAVVVIDADSEADPALLRVFDASLAAGAQAVQAHYAVLNARDSWRTRLMAIAMSAFHTVRSRGREHLGLSCGIRGNGWCVSARLLRELPFGAFSVVEDVEYGARLGLAGHRVEYVEAACVRAEMVSQAGNAAPQRRRWEQGRAALRRELVPPLLGAHNRICLDLAADLLVPPLSQLLLLVLGCAFAAWATGADTALMLAQFSAAALLLYVARGWQLSGLGLGALADFLRVPWFMIWKLGVLLRNAGNHWARTTRERP